MEKPLFIMESKRIDFLRYCSLALMLSLSVSFLFTPITGFYLFFTLILIPHTAKHRTILVFDNSLTEKDSEGRFIKQVNARQIDSFRKTMLGNISLIDSDRGRLLSIKNNMTNRDLFEQWLVSHHIESK